MTKFRILSIAAQDLQVSRGLGACQPQPAKMSYASFSLCRILFQGGGEIIITGVDDLRVDPEKIQKMLLR